MEPADNCHNALAPLQFSDICASAADTHHSRTIDLPAGTCVTEIGIHWISGHVNCRKASTGVSNFGCDDNMVGLVWTEHNGKDVIMPKKARSEVSDALIMNKRIGTQWINEDLEKD